MCGLTALNVPDVDNAGMANRKQLCLWAHGQARRQSCCFVPVAQLTCVRHVPQVDRTILSSRNHHLAVGAGGEVHHRAGVAGWHDQLTVGGVLLRNAV